MTLPASTTGKLEAVRQKVIEANPEILKLDFGCLVRVGEITRGSFAHCVLPGEGLGRDTFICVGRCRPPTDSKLIFQHQAGFCHVDEVEVAKFHEIIGRPICLADVCKAIQEVGTSNLHDCPDGGRNVASVLLDLWDFDHDDLERQTEECVNYLSSLLVR